ncbi:helix-turn-helix domain-containing protein [Bacillus coahuilensis]|uniref:helix-turn-helix domain-containing protein n=1 Tax=Bacillus coahuilensis TaxID=408580 RepID=UPI00031736C2|nr:helix-turn-helix transcriptional regulator [Bacillus coahuilensis]
MMNFYERLREYREDVLNLSQTEVAQRLHITQSAFSRLEQGQTDLTMKQLMIIKKAYHLSNQQLVDLLDEYESEAPPNASVLRETFQEEEDLEILTLLKNYPKEKQTLAQLRFYTPKEQQVILSSLLFQKRKN